MAAQEQEYSRAERTAQAIDALYRHRKTGVRLTFDEMRDCVELLGWDSVHFFPAGDGSGLYYFASDWKAEHDRLKRGK